MKFIYVIAGDRYAKVGFATSLFARLGAIQTGCPFPLKVAHTVPVLPGYAPSIEKAAHRELAEYRREDEWFECPDAVAIAAVEKVAGPHRIVAHRASDTLWRLSQGEAPPPKASGMIYLRHRIEQDEFMTALSTGAARHMRLALTCRACGHAGEIPIARLTKSQRFKCSGCGSGI